MQSFYQDWLKKNNEENNRAMNQIQMQKQTNTPKIIDPTPSTSTGEEVHPTPSTSNDPTPSTSKNLHNIQSTAPVLSSSDIVYQKDGLQLLVERGLFQRQKKFSLQE